MLLRGYKWISFQAAGDMRDEKRSMFRVHRVILSALSKEFRDIFSTFSASFGDEGIKTRYAKFLQAYQDYKIG